MSIVHCPTTNSAIQFLHKNQNFSKTVLSSVFKPQKGDGKSRVTVPLVEWWYSMLYSVYLSSAMPNRGLNEHHDLTIDQFGELSSKINFPSLCWNFECSIFLVSYFLIFFSVKKNNHIPFYFFHVNFFQYLFSFVNLSFLFLNYLIYYGLDSFPLSPLSYFLYVSRKKST